MPTETTRNTNSEFDPATGKIIKDKIHMDLNPGADLKHNQGRSKPAPYASADQDDQRGRAATFLTNCSKENLESLQCIERNYSNRQACNGFFQAYKDCRKEENEQRKADNAKIFGGSGSGWFW